ncbi:MAG: helix-turn-helix domain-containing protein [Clostridia bacterium]|nr:helix-turn-helix domain-containing protein [Clostridia bacterium]
MNNVFSDNLKRFRQEKKFTQEQVAEALGVSTHTVSRWECSTTLPDVLMLPKLARLYCVTVDDFFKESSTAYENYAQRLASVFEATHDPEDFFRVDIEFKKLIKDNKLTTLDMWLYGVSHQFMMNYCIEKAFYWFDKVLEIGENEDRFSNHRAKLQRMKLCSQLGKDEENIKTQKENVDKNIGNANEWCMLLAAYMFADRYEEAYEWFVKAISRFPDEWELYIHGGDICKKLKKYDEAFEYWDKAESLGTDFLDGKYSKAQCLEDIGKYEESGKIWQEIAESLINKGYDIEAQMPKQHAKACLEKTTA